MEIWVKYRGRVYVYNGFHVFVLAVFHITCCKLKRDVWALNEEIQKGIELETFTSKL